MVVSHDVENFGFSDIGDAINSIKHGAEVNFANIKHGIDVNWDNLIHGIDVAVQDTKHAIDVNATNLRRYALQLFPLTVIGRNAFLALLKVNAFNLAHRARAAAEAGGGKRISDRWYNDLAGDRKALDIAISQGNGGISVNMERGVINGKNYGTTPGKPLKTSSYTGATEYGIPYENAAGVDDAALLAAASGIIAAMIPLFIKDKKSDEDVQNTTDKALKVVSQQLRTGALPPEYAGIITSTNKNTGTGNTGNNTGSDMAQYMPIVLVAIVAIVLFFALKKK
jgi:hypothetical protein